MNPSSYVGNGLTDRHQIWHMAMHTELLYLPTGNSVMVINQSIN